MTALKNTLLSLVAICISSASAASYTVKSGDTLYSLARQSKIEMTELMRINNLSTTTLKIGQVLNLGNNNQYSNLPDPAAVVALASRSPMVATPNTRSTGKIAVAPNASKVVATRSRARVRAAASRYLGIRYVYGGMSTRGIDCSAFTLRVFRTLGIYLPRTAAAQWRRGFAVSRRNLREGDLVFFNTSGRGVSHVGIYMGRGMMANANSYHGRTLIEPLFSNSYWAARYMGARRVM